MTKLAKNQYVNLLKGIACIIVIFLHCPFPGMLGEGIIYGLRFSVPVFFMISGYYSCAKSDGWVFEKGKYIFKLLVFSELFYGVWTFIKQCILKGNSIEQVARSIFADKNIIEVIFCGTIFNGTLWYLYAMFWTWMILLALRKAKILDKCYIIMLLLLGIQIFGRFYVQNHFDINKWVFLFRNVLTFGLPFSLLGIWMSKQEEVLKEKIDLRKNICFIALGFVLIVVEFLVSGQYMDTHVSTIVISFGLFLYAIRMTKPVNKCYGVLVRIGGKWYTWIYLSHIFWVDLIDILYDRLGLTSHTVFGFMRPILVCILACICAEGMVRMIEKKNTRRNIAC